MLVMAYFMMSFGSFKVQAGDFNFRRNRYRLQGPATENGELTRYRVDDAVNMRQLSGQPSGLLVIGSAGVNSHRHGV